MDEDSFAVLQLHSSQFAFTGSLLGEGTFGEVRACFDETTRCMHAVKRVKLSSEEAEEGVQTAE